ncbi:MAG: aminodeoxychorismate synthase component I [Gammaproteobacteria bacterium]|nr:aminodeoxychorismate synthase component I [Gammaproteobacteria bacterium]
MLQHSIQYFDDSSRYYQALASLKLPILLNSQGAGRYDIIVAEPFMQLITHGEQTTITEHNAKDRLSSEPPLQLIEEMLSKRKPTQPGVLFCGGAVGLLGYDLGRLTLKKEYACPDMVVGIFDWALVIDHTDHTTHLYSAGMHPSTALLWPELIERLSDFPPLAPQEFQVSNPSSNLPSALYQSCFERIKSYISQGDCYQVNLAQRLRFDFTGSSFAAYQNLRKSRAQFAAFIKGDGFEILSFSPEQFLQIDYPWAQTKPIKGTRPRSLDPIRDHFLREDLVNSPKDRAENLMIVDLLRNDFSKVCEPFSVKVPAIFEIESLPAVHHLVSTVSGKLKPGLSPIALLQACFPGGSITGAPKIRAMEIIDEVEPNQRGPYCGTIFYIGWDWHMDSNIAIRSLLREGGSLYCWAGGGIVHDSELKAEYQETQDKVSLILQMLEVGFPEPTKLG